MKLAFTSLFSLFIAFTFGQDYSEFMKVVADDRDTEDRFGWSVDIDGNFAIVGAYADDYGPLDPNMGAAYIYQKVAGEWIQIQKLSNSDQEDYDRFGWSVAIDGNYAVIGAYGEDDDEDGENNLSKAGSAYIFERDEDGVWQEIQKLVAFDRAANDEFGWSVAIHGNTIVVGAHIDDKDEDGEGFFYHAGSAYIFDRNDDGEWIFSQKIVAPDRGPGTVYDPEHEDWNDRFGEYLGIWNDYLIVGAPFAAKGYMFERSGGTWSLATLLVYPGISWIDRAGPASIDSTTAVLGASTEDHDETGGGELMNAGGAFIYKRDDVGDWNLEQKIVASDRSAGDHFGISISIDDGIIAVGAHQDNHDEDTEEDLENAGSIYVFELGDDGEYFEQVKLDASDREIEDQLGISISVSGNTFISGAFQQDYTPEGEDYLEDAGAAYFYTTDPDDFGDCPVYHADQAIEICTGTVYEIGEHTYSEAGSYYDTLSTFIYGCDSIVNTVLSVLPPIEYEQDIFLCYGESLAVGDSTYDTSGTYTNLLSNEFGCDSIVTTILTLGDSLSSEQEFSICYGESVSVGESVYDESGSYTDLFASIDGCDSLVFTTLEVAEEIDTEVIMDNIFLAAQATDVEYQWLSCDPYEVIEGETDALFEADANGIYAVIIYDGTCTDTSDCFEITAVGIDEEAYAQLSVYPNPANDQFIVSGEQLIGTKLQLFSTRGELIYDQKIVNSITVVSVSHLSAGIYILKIAGEQGVRTEPITIE